MSMALFVRALIVKPLALDIVHGRPCACIDPEVKVRMSEIQWQIQKFVLGRYFCGLGRGEGAIASRMDPSSTDERRVRAADGTVQFSSSSSIGCAFKHTRLTAHFPGRDYPGEPVPER